MSSLWLWNTNAIASKALVLQAKWEMDRYRSNAGLPQGYSPLEEPCGPASMPHGAFGLAPLTSEEADSLLETADEFVGLVRLKRLKMVWALCNVLRKLCTSLQ